mmetsp:Transcript_24993/g.77742  ORF Transcript_24993/g.77742 Transcript_24993/m.77742 type:complete len:266 (-) Transcript_24993:1313-2110(-)
MHDGHPLRRVAGVLQAPLEHALGHLPRVVRLKEVDDAEAHDRCRRLRSLARDLLPTSGVEAGRAAGDRSSQRGRHLGGRRRRAPEREEDGVVHHADGRQELVVRPQSLLAEAAVLLEAEPVREAGAEAAVLELRLDVERHALLGGPQRAAPAGRARGEALHEDGVQPGSQAVPQAVAAVELAEEAPGMPSEVVPVGRQHRLQVPAVRLGDGLEHERPAVRSCQNGRPALGCRPVEACLQIALALLELVAEPSLLHAPLTTQGSKG